MLGRFFGRIVWLGLCVVFIGTAHARSAEATFDDLTPGVYGNTLVDGEILFDKQVGVLGHIRKPENDGSRLSDEEVSHPERRKSVSYTASGLTPRALSDFMA